VLALSGDTGKPVSRGGGAVANDGAVLRAVARGDLTHFDAFVDRHKVGLLNYIHQRVRDAHRAEDLTQEVFLRAFQAAARGEYRGRADASAWLFAIARNCATDYLRTLQQSPSALQADMDDHPDNARDVQGRVPGGVQRQPRFRVDQVLAQLPPPQREVVALKVFADLSFREIAEVMDCPVSTAKARMGYALRRLAGLLSPGQGACK